MSRTPVARPPRVVSAAPRLAARADADRRAHRSVWARRTGWGLGICLPLALLGWLVLGSSLLGLQKVVVAGEHRLTAAQITAVVDVPAGTPLARVDTSAVASRVGALAAVAGVTVTRSWPHGLKVTVVERVPVVAVPQGANVLLLDTHGVRVATVKAVPAGVYPLAVPATDQAATVAALAVLRGLPMVLRHDLVRLTATSPEQVTLVLTHGRRVLWGGAADGRAKALALHALLKMPGTVFDVSAPGVVTRR